MGFLRAGKRVSYETALCRYDSSYPTRVGFGVFPAPFADASGRLRGLRRMLGPSLLEGCACIVHGERVAGGWGIARGGGVRVRGSGLRWRWWRAPFVCPQDRLRQAQGERRGSEARLRCGLVGACRRPAHLWIPAFAGTTMAGVGSRRGGDAPAPGPCPGFPRRRERRWGGVRDARGLVGACRRPGHLWIPAFAGMTVAGVGSSRGGGAPRRAPALGSRFRENDGGRGAGGACRYCVGVPHPAPLDSCLRRNDAGSSAGTTVGECGTRGGCGWGRKPFDRLRANGISIGL